MTIPNRIVAAVAYLDPQPGDQVLEIGCGNGAAAVLVCERLDSGHLVGIDRSQKQIRLASERLRPHLQAGRASLQVAALESAPFAVALKTGICETSTSADDSGFQTERRIGDARFDKIFAINVNCFWLRYEQPLAVVRRLLKPDGTFFIFYEHPSIAKTREVAPILRNNLIQSGFAIRQETVAGPVYCLASSPRSEEGE